MTPWQLFVDLGFAAILLLIGQLLRSNVRLIQRLFIPASVMGGFIGLGLGPNGADVLKLPLDLGGTVKIELSDAISTYPGILIALVFATLPFATKHADFRTLSRRVTGLWSFSSVAILLQWGLGILFTLLVLKSIWQDLNPGFGSVIAAGFVGGHGTAAAIGETFSELGWPDARSLAMTSATVGILSSIVGGMIWVKWASLRGHTQFVTRFDDLPEALRTGLVKEGDREAVGEETVSSNAIDTLVFHFCLISAAAFGGYFLSKWWAGQFKDYTLPVFCLAYIVSLILYRVFRWTGAIKYVDRKTMTHLAGALTDILVVFGVASIKPSVLVTYALPLTLLFVLGIVMCCLIFRFLGPRFFESYWLERSLFTWGWITGVTAMGIALLRIVDPRNRSDTLADFGIAYLFIAPVEIGVLAVAPAMLAKGHSWPLAVITLGGAILLTVITIAMRRVTTAAASD